MVVMVAITRSPVGTKSRVHSLDRLLKIDDEVWCIERKKSAHAGYRKKSEGRAIFILHVLLLSMAIDGGHPCLQRAKQRVRDGRREISGH